MSLAFARRWWGELDGVLHSFKTLVDSGQTLTRMERKASCGWLASGGVLESPDELGRRQCQHCLVSSDYTRACDGCDGSGKVERCPQGHHGCDCSTHDVLCPQCHGSRVQRLSDEEVALLEGYVSEAMTG